MSSSYDMVDGLDLGLTGGGATPTKATTTATSPARSAVSGFGEDNGGDLLDGVPRLRSGGIPMPIEDEIWGPNNYY